MGLDLRFEKSAPRQTDVGGAKQELREATDRMHEVSRQLRLVKTELARVVPSIVLQATLGLEVTLDNGNKITPKISNEDSRNALIDLLTDGKLTESKILEEEFKFLETVCRNLRSQISAAQTEFKANTAEVDAMGKGQLK